MKKISKIIVSALSLAMAGGWYFFDQIRLFDPIQMQLESPKQRDFYAIDDQCFAAFTPVHPLEKTHFRLLSWNIHKGADEGWQQDLSRFAQGQDFVLLQEATPQQNLPGFSTALFVSSFAYKGLSSGVKTFSAFTPQHYCALSQTEPWLRIPKVASEMRFPLASGKSLQVINVHLINFEWLPEAYRTQLEQIFSLIQPHQSAVILAGDFNAWNEERKNILNEFVTQASLQNVDFSPDERSRFLGNPLDYVFVRGMKIVSAKTEKVTSSDHSPVWVEVVLDE